MKKGISLSINIMVVLILAVIVLVVLIGIFFSVAGPTQSVIKARLAQTQVCSAYRNTDVNCNDKTKYDEFEANNEELLKELGDACNTLSIPGCSSPASLTCIQSCCIGCGEAEIRPTTQDECFDQDASCAAPNCPSGKTQIGSCGPGILCCK